MRPLPFPPTRFECGNTKLLCPICGGEFVHPVRVYCNPAGESGGIVAIDHRGVDQRPVRTPHGRGVHVILTFMCEGGHHFSCEFEFYKGNTFVRRKHLPHAPESKTIWRD